MEIGGWSENTQAVAEVLPRRQWFVMGYQERTEGEKTDSREPWRGIGKPLCWDRPGVESQGWVLFWFIFLL